MQLVNKVKISGRIFKEDRNTEIKKLLASFEFEIDNNPNNYINELRIINKINAIGGNWQNLIYLELISEINRIVRSRQRSQNYSPFVIDFIFVASCFYTPNFGVKSKYKKIKK